MSMIVCVGYINYYPVMFPGVHRAGPRGQAPGGRQVRQETLLDLRGRSARGYTALYGDAGLPQGHR